MQIVQYFMPGVVKNYWSVIYLRIMNIDFPLLARPIDTAEQLFILINVIALLGWLLLIFAPYRRLTRRLVYGQFITRILAVFYCFLLIFTAQNISLSDISLSSLTEFMSDPWILLLGWTHIVCFDLIAGIWINQDAIKRGIRHRYMVGTLLLTFLFGPLGFIAYYATRFLSQQLGNRINSKKQN